MHEAGPDSGPQSPTSAPKLSGGRQRIISSCLTCRRRKVKCDHVHPICGACTRGSHLCTWSDQSQGQAITGRISKPAAIGNGKVAKNGDVQTRLDRLELLLEKAVAGQTQKAPTSVRSSAEYDRSSHETQMTPSSTSQTSHSGGGLACDDGDGTLLIDGGQSKFVSSLHYALLADEVSGSLRSLIIRSWMSNVVHLKHSLSRSDPRYQSPSGRQDR